MPIVTADGITTPDYNSSGDIVPALTTMGATIQTALDTRANSYRGTSSEREAFRTAAPEGTLWADTNGPKVLWQKRGSNWVRIHPEWDSGWVTNFIRAQSGWKVRTDTTNNIRRIGDWVNINCTFTRTGGTISVPATGDITNVTVAILNVAWRPAYWQAVHSGESGRLAAFSLGSNGHVRLNAVGGTANIGTNSNFSIRGWYRRNFDHGS